MIAIWITVGIAIVLMIWIGMSERTSNPSLKSISNCSIGESLRYLNNKTEKFKARDGELSENIRLLRKQAHKEISLASELNDTLSCVVGEHIIDGCIVKQGGHYYSHGDDINYYIRYNNSDHDVFNNVEFTTDCPHAKRFNRLKDVINKYKKESHSIDEVQQKISRSLKILKNEQSYKDTLEQIKEFSGRDKESIKDFNIDSVVVEINALEKQIDLELEIA